MYPKVFADYAAERSAYGDVSILPTPVFFYGMQPGQEINIDLERGKTLIVRYVTHERAHEDGTRTVFFELNGQPRPMRVADRSQVAKRPPQRKVGAGQRQRRSARRCRAPSATVPVHAGQQVARGDVLVTLEAMKMETTVQRRARRHGQRGPREAGSAGGRQGSAGRIRVRPK